MWTYALYVKRQRTKISRDKIDALGLICTELVQRNKYVFALAQTQWNFLHEKNDVSQLTKIKKRKRNGWHDKIGKWDVSCCAIWLRDTKVCNRIDRQNANHATSKSADIAFLRTTSQTHIIVYTLMISERQVFQPAVFIKVKCATQRKMVGFLTFLSLMWLHQSSVIREHVQITSVSNSTFLQCVCVLIHTRIPLLYYVFVVVVGNLSVSRQSVALSGNTKFVTNTFRSLESV